MTSPTSTWQDDLQARVLALHEGEREHAPSAFANQPSGVRLAGLVPDADLPALVEGGLGLVFCASYEGFGIPPVEAMASGCPAVRQLS